MGVFRADDVSFVFGAQDVEAVSLVGDILVYQRAGQLQVVSALDGAALGQCATDLGWGLALDASYLWTAGAAGITVHELDGSVRWSAAGDLGDAKVLATAEAVHLFDADLAPQSVWHFAATDGGTKKDAFTGTFGGWFADGPRWWTTYFNSHRIWDPGGVMLGVGDGSPVYAWGTRVVVGSTVRDVFKAGVLAIIPLNDRRFSGPAIFTTKEVENGYQTTLLRLDQDPVTSTKVQPYHCAYSASEWDFAFAGDAWVLGCESGQALDHLNRSLAAGPESVTIAGSAAGRVAVTTRFGEVRVFDVGANCSAQAYPPLAIAAYTLLLPADGSQLISSERWQPEININSTFPGNRFYSLPQGVLQASNYVHLAHPYIMDVDISDDGSRWSRLADDFFDCFAFDDMVPNGIEQEIAGNHCSVPKVAPNGHHVAHSVVDLQGPLQDYNVVVHELDDVVAKFPGVPIGFIDDEHILINHYTNSNFVKAEIVDLDGLVVQTPMLPHLQRIYRLGTGEFLGIRNDSHDSAIHDPVTGDVLWQAPTGVAVALAGNDHLLLADVRYPAGDLKLNPHGRVSLVRWR
jgi:hypothetical protein